MDKQLKRFAKGLDATVKNFNKVRSKLGDMEAKDYDILADCCLQVRIAAHKVKLLARKYAQRHGD